MDIERVLRKLRKERADAKKALGQARRQRPPDPQQLAYLERYLQECEREIAEVERAQRRPTQNYSGLAEGTRMVAPVTREQAIAWVLDGKNRRVNGCAQLWERIQRHDLRVLCGLHVGGYERPGHRADMTLHCTVSVGGTSYHLRFKLEGKLPLLFDITSANGRLAPAFWRAPGT